MFNLRLKHKKISLKKHDWFSSHSTIYNLISNKLAHDYKKNANEKDIKK